LLVGGTLFLLLQCTVLHALNAGQTTLLQLLVSSLIAAVPFFLFQALKINKENSSNV
jgi:hypothetical protein